MADRPKQTEGFAKSNVVKRIVTGISLIIYMIIAMYYGAPLIIFTILLIQMKCFDEVIQIAFKLTKIPNTSNFRKIRWYLIFTVNYLFAGEILSKRMEVFRKRYQILFFFNHHRFTSFCLYFFGMLWFLTLMKKGIMRQQFSLMFWTHFLLIIIAWPSYLAMQNVFEGIIWVMLPLGVVIINDVFSYAFGRTFGKTPLTNLSPKKTWEGLILGGISTLFLGPVLAYLFSLSDHLACPIEYKEVGNEIVLHTHCGSSSYLFQVHSYEIGSTGYLLSVNPLIMHSIVFSLFGSVIGPFGGFFASGFKRAVGVKDFGDLIPGHGGLLDRFDCQFLMAIFAKAYICTFIRTDNVEKVFQKILSLDTQKQLEFFYLLQHSLKENNYTDNLM